MSTKRNHDRREAPFSPAVGVGLNLPPKRIKSKWLAHARLPPPKPPNTATLRATRCAWVTTACAGILSAPRLNRGKRQPHSRRSLGANKGFPLPDLQSVVGFDHCTRVTYRDGARSPERCALRWGHRWLFSCWARATMDPRDNGTASMGSSNRSGCPAEPTTGGNSRAVAPRRYETATERQCPIDRWRSPVADARNLISVTLRVLGVTG